MCIRDSSPHNRRICRSTSTIPTSPFRAFDGKGTVVCSASDACRRRETDSTDRQCKGTNSSSSCSTVLLHLDSNKMSWKTTIATRPTSFETMEDSFSALTLSKAGAIDRENYCSDGFLRRDEPNEGEIPRWRNENESVQHWIDLIPDRASLSLSPPPFDRLPSIDRSIDQITIDQIGPFTHQYFAW